MKPDEYTALWDEAAALLEPGTVDAESLKLARAGHVHAREIVGALIPSTECPCGAEEPCPGVDVNTPEMVRQRDVLTRLRAAMGEP